MTQPSKVTKQRIKRKQITSESFRTADNRLKVLLEQLRWDVGETWTSFYAVETVWLCWRCGNTKDPVGVFEFYCPLQWNRTRLGCSGVTRLPASLPHLQPIGGGFGGLISWSFFFFLSFLEGFSPSAGFTAFKLNWRHSGENQSAALRAIKTKLLCLNVPPRSEMFICLFFQLNVWASLWRMMNELSDSIQLFSHSQLKRCIFSDLTESLI